MSISGLCSGSSFDKHYYWTGEYSKDTELYYFRGFSNSLLHYEPKKSEWKLTLYSNPNVYATCNQTAIHTNILKKSQPHSVSSVGYPFGTFQWIFFGDTCKMIGSEKILTKNIYNLTISFNACNESSEFTCGDGTW